MVSPLQSNSNAELQDDKSISNFGDLALRPDIRPELLVRLSGKLQVTLDIQLLLAAFFSEMQAAVLVDGLVFINQDRGLEVQQGKTAAHTVSYKLQTKQWVLGEIIFHRSTRFREHELANIEGLLSTLVYPLRNGLTHQQALATSCQDTLTSLVSRVAFNRAIDREIAIARQHQIPLILTCIDLDGLESICNQYGHNISDQILCETANIIQRHVDPTDLCCRFDKDTFVILSSVSTITQQRQIAEHIVSQVPRIEKDNTTSPVATRVACTELQDGDTAESLLQRTENGLQRDSGSDDECIESTADTRKAMAPCR